MCLSQIFNQTNVRRLLTIFSLEKTSNQVFRSQIFQVTKKEIITKDFSLKVTFQFGVQNRQTRFISNWRGRGENENMLTWRDMRHSGIVLKGQVTLYHLKENRSWSPSKCHTQIRDQRLIKRTFLLKADFSCPFRKYLKHQWCAWQDTTTQKMQSNDL